MNKSLITNLVTAVVVATGYLSGNSLVFSIGLFAFSGALTNWLAVHMLFEKVPCLYGSGVIPARFEEVKAGIKQLMLEQFFTKDNIDRFLSDASGKAAHINIAPVVEQTDFRPAYHALVQTIEASSFGSMLAMFGGSEALKPLEEPFVAKLKAAVIEISESDEFNENLRSQIEAPDAMQDIQSKIAEIIDQRLSELTPALVKQMVQQMIKQHLGWLVVWGGVFGGLFGLVHGLI